MPQQVSGLQHFLLRTDPIPKGRPRLGRGHTYTPGATKAAEAGIGWLLREQGAQSYGADVPLSLRVGFHIRRPQRVREGALPTGRPDLDNLLKLILDACNGLLWEDDAQIVSISTRKLYAETGCSGYISITVWVEQ